MRRKLTALLVGCLLACASTAWSYTISVNGGTTDVGGKDDVKYATELHNSGDQTEIDWINQKLGTHYTTADYTKDEQVTWTQVAGQPFIYAYDLAGTPEYYLIKTGNNKINNLDTYLVQNNASLEWAVLDLQDILAINIVKKTGAINPDPGKIGHVGEAGSAPVPEPGTMMLLGAGFLGLAVYGKRRRNA